MQTTPANENAGLAPGALETANDGGEHTKQARILEALRSPAGLNRFEAERLGDHCLNSTIARLRAYGVAIHSVWENVPTRFSARGARVLRYWAWWGGSHG